MPSMRHFPPSFLSDKVRRRALCSKITALARSLAICMSRPTEKVLVGGNSRRTACGQDFSAPALSDRDRLRVKSSVQIRSPSLRRLAV